MNDQNQPQPDNRTAYDVFRFYMSPAHVEKPTPVIIERAFIDDVYNAKSRQKEPALIVQFQRAHRVLKLNKTQTEELFGIAGDDFNKWRGVKVILSPATAGNKKTIKITKA